MYRQRAEFEDTSSDNRRADRMHQRGQNKVNGDTHCRQTQPLLLKKNIPTFVAQCTPPKNIIHADVSQNPQPPVSKRRRPVLPPPSPPQISSIPTQKQFTFFDKTDKSQTTKADVSQLLLKDYRGLKHLFLSSQRLMLPNNKDFLRTGFAFFYRVNYIGILAYLTHVTH